MNIIMYVKLYVYLKVKLNEVYVIIPTLSPGCYYIIIMYLYSLYYLDLFVLTFSTFLMDATTSYKMIKCNTKDNTIISQ